MAKKRSSDVGKAVGIGAPAAAGGALGFALGGPVGAAIGTFLGGLLGIIGVGKVEEKERQAKAQTDPFLEEKKAAIRRLLQMSPYLPDMSYSDFARMLGIEDKKRSFIVPPLVGSPLSGIMTGLLSSALSEQTPVPFIFTSPQSAIISSLLMNELKKGDKKGR
jgi:hypothetical protein